jgi:hypothetical protein
MQTIRGYSFPVDEKKRTKEESCQSNADIRAGAAARLLFRPAGVHYSLLMPIANRS